MKTYNPDVLNCLANLSNDEVFTPPALANQVLDMLPQELFCSPDTTFLDPVSKSGIFLREIVKRLDRGLQLIIPDRQQRIDHIMHHQVFGIATTELTSYISRRSLYCSRDASGQYSVSHFDSAEGNIIYRNLRHTWQKGKCIYCGASQEVYDRTDADEHYAYQFIHTDYPQKLFPNMNIGASREQNGTRSNSAEAQPNVYKINDFMKFDVIIGNPPYQLSDGGGRESSATSLYHKFIIQAKRLSPRYLCMIVPARWYTGGKGLDDFRDEMLKDTRIRVIHDFQETNDCFPGVNIRGGVCYFLWDAQNHGLCKVVNHIKGEESVMIRPLLEKDCSVFIRHNASVSILKKVQKLNGQTFSNIVSSRKPFGIESNFKNFVTICSKQHNIKLYRFGETGYVNIENIEKQQELIPRWKVLVSKASPGGDEYPHSIVSQPIIAEPNSACTETYLVIKDFDNEEECYNLVSYIKTRFFRFMMSLMKNTQNISKASYSFVPLQDFSHPWTDEMLYKKYKLTDEEIAFIESMIRPME